ncbi:DsrE family protein [Vagococcus sp. BWB3-3]|uniref:DsrE family protein n=1 Tax=Vagococcus allomyrinae TaxID=2794353 RepID=A0A940SU40_9ENTE|nr:DsrE family protein [Vagococcus allomyrinae]MBP1043872.1 DsrE family protein [Vagococcus allomyrinae]
MLKAVFHLNELEKWAVTLGNIRNLMKETQEAEIKVLVNGGAIAGYLDQDIIEQLSQFQPKIVTFEACQNALKSHHMARTQLPKDVKVVPVGVIRLIELQQHGYAYIKP